MFSSWLPNKETKKFLWKMFTGHKEKYGCKHNLIRRTDMLFLLGICIVTRRTNNFFLKKFFFLKRIAEGEWVCSFSLCTYACALCPMKTHLYRAITVFVFWIRENMYFFSYRSVQVFWPSLWRRTIHGPGWRMPIPMHLSRVKVLWRLSVWATVPAIHWPAVQTWMGE